MVEKILAIAASLVLVFVVSVMIYDVGKQNVVTVVDFKAGSDPNIILREFAFSDNIEAVRKVDKSDTKFEIIFRTRKTAHQLLEMLKDNNSVEKAELSNLFGVKSHN